VSTRKDTEYVEEAWATNSLGLFDGFYNSNDYAQVYGVGVYGDSRYRTEEVYSVVGLVISLPPFPSRGLK